MTTLRCDMTMSLGGYVCGAEGRRPPTSTRGPSGSPPGSSSSPAGGSAGDGWGAVVDADDALVAETFAQAGAYVMGRQMFDPGEGPWGPSRPSMRRCSWSPTATAPGWSATAARPSSSSPTVCALDLAKTAAGESGVHVSGGRQI